MKIHHTKISTLMVWCLLIKLISFALLSLAILDQSGTFPGGWVGQIKIKDQLSPVEAEIGAELGKKILDQAATCVAPPLLALAFQIIGESQLHMFRLSALIVT